LWGVGERGWKEEGSLGVGGYKVFGKGREMGVQISNAFQFAKLKYTW